MKNRGFTERTKRRVHDIKTNYGIRRQKSSYAGNCVLGMPGPCEHVGGAMMRTQIINLRLVTNHEVAGSEAEKSASSGRLSTEMSNVPYFINLVNSDMVRE